MNFANHVDMEAENTPEAVAMTDPTREMTYRELAAETNAVANGLADRGVDPGDAVALFVPNTVTFITAYFGAMKLGAIPVPINLRFGTEEIGHVLADSGARTLFTIDRFADAFADEDLGLENFVVAGGGETGTDYGRLVADAEKSFEVHPRTDDELAEILYTSGTTGRPKGVRHSHGNLSANGLAARRYLFSADDVALTVCPLFHVSGLNVTTTPLVMAGAENHFLPEWDAGAALETLAAREVNVTMLIPTMVIDILEHGTEGYDLSALRYVVVGGAPMPKERIETVEERLGVTLLEGYGMTETTPSAVLNSPEQDTYKAGSIGTPLRDVVDVRIEDPETGREVATDEKGELLVRGDTVMPGYYEMPEKNEEAFVERPAPEKRGGDAAADGDGGAWLRTGDIVRRDADGHLFVEDRIDDMIITGGENVYPREIEDVIYELDGVVEAAVIGTPHERLGERVTAVVRGEGVTEDDVQAVCRRRLADHKVPREVRLVGELPKTATRKVDKVTLREQLA